MLSFLRWFAAAVFVSLMIGVVAGNLTREDARRYEERRNPYAGPRHYENIETQAHWQAFSWAAGGAFVLMIIAGRIKLPARLGSIAWGALAGTIVAFVVGVILSVLLERGGKYFNEIFHVILWYGIPILGVLGGIIGDVRYRRRKPEGAPASNCAMDAMNTV